MMRRKRRLSIYDIGSLPSVPVVDEPRQSLKRFQRAEEARMTAEKEATEAAERARIEATRLAELNSPASVKIAMYWRQPLQAIRTNMSNAVYDNGKSLTPVDLFGAYESGPRDSEAEISAFKAFQENLASAGCNLSVLGGVRLTAYLESLAYHRCVSLTSVANWATALERLYSLDAFHPGELTGYSHTSIPEPEPEPHADPLKEIETLNLDSRDGNRRAKEIADRDFFGRQFAAIADQWRDWLIATFNYVLTDEAQKAAGQWWINNPTESPLHGEAWTRLRLNLVKRGVMPASCKTREELLNETIEASSERSDSYETRRNLKQQIRELAHK